MAKLPKIDSEGLRLAAKEGAARVSSVTAIDIKADKITCLLNALACDAFEVLNWARREGMKRPAQIGQVIDAFRKTLDDAKATIDLKE